MNSEPSHPRDAIAALVGRNRALVWSGIVGLSGLAWLYLVYLSRGMSVQDCARVTARRRELPELCRDLPGRADEERVEDRRLTRSDLVRAVEYGQLAVQKAPTPGGKAFAQAFLAWASGRAGEPHRGVEILGQIVSIMRAGNFVPAENLFPLFLGEGYWRVP